MNSKECLKRLKEMSTCSECELYGECFERPLCNELYNTIKQDLDRLEKLEKEHNKLKENRKLKEVIKIIITKGVNELFLKNTKTSDDYNKIIKQLEYFDELTQEEYELLKEVLEDE